MAKKKAQDLVAYASSRIATLTPSDSAPIAVAPHVVTTPIVVETNMSRIPAARNASLSSLSSLPSLALVETDKDLISIDKVADVTQKEKRLHKAGVTREKAFAIVSAALTAKKIVIRLDDMMNETTVEEPDFEKNKWGAEMTAKYFGDMVERKIDESKTTALFACVDGALRTRMMMVSKTVNDSMVTAAAPITSALPEATISKDTPHG